MQLTARLLNIHIQEDFLVIPKLILGIVSAAAATTIISNRLKSIKEKMDSGNKVQLHKACQLLTFKIQVL